MKLTTIGTVIAERSLDLRPGGKVVVRIGKPRKSRGHNDYFCPYEIRWPHKHRISYCVGIDTVQAMQLTMYRVAMDLYTAAEAKKLTWLGMRNLGLPVPEYALDIVPKEGPRKAPKRSAARSSSRKKPSRG